MDAKACDDGRRVSQAHRRQVKAVCGQVIRGLGQLFGRFDQLRANVIHNYLLRYSSFKSILRQSIVKRGKTVSHLIYFNADGL